MGFWDRLLCVATDVIGAVVEADGTESLEYVMKQAALKSVVMGIPHVKLTPQQASRPCTDFTPQELLNLLNEYTHKNRTMDYKERLEPTLKQVCDGSIPSDLGTIYSWFRLDAMGTELGFDFSTFQDPHRCKPVTISTLKSGAKVLPFPETTYPARIWDLCSNRVIPFEWFRARHTAMRVFQKVAGEHEFAAISHSWTADMVMNTTTPVNQYQYPVPLPAGVNLEDIRQEILKICGREGECCWLDVVCNRQKYVDDDERPLPGWEESAEKGEEKRALEWQTDLPLIGVIYEKASHVVRYYNGLGRPFSSEGWESEKHWRNRVWTLQEIGCGANITGGIREGGEQFSLDMTCKNGEKYETAKELLKGSLFSRSARLWKQEMMVFVFDDYPEREVWSITWNMFQDVVREVNRRRCTNPRDRLIVLAYLSRCDPIPVYSSNLSIEEMFDVVWECLSKEARVNIKTGMECQPGIRPTWTQILDRLDAHPQD